MQCSRCRKIFVDDAMFCPNCGMAVNIESSNVQNRVLYKLTENDKRSYTITVNSEKISFSGKFWYLKDKEFVRCREKQETALVQNFMGMGYLAKRSFKKCLLFILAGSVLEVVKVIVDKVTEWIDKANDYLKWIDKSISMPEWVDTTMNVMAIICILLAVVLFFSKKKVIEISFTDKRICVPQKSMSKSEYNMLYQSIQNARKNM